MEGSLPVPVVAPTGTLVSLSAILEQSFGTTAPTPYGMTLVSPKILFNTATDHKYWSDSGCGAGVVRQWCSDQREMTLSNRVTAFSCWSATISLSRRSS